jgi:ferredoxin-type protein NapH
MVKSGTLADRVLTMLGRDPVKPEACAEDAARLHALRREDPAAFLAARKAARATHATSHRWRNRRWVVLVAVNLLFVVSLRLDIQLLEGSLTASRFAGFHLIDLNSALQVMLAHKHIIVNLVIGTATVFVLWLMLGGRSFCSWVCPYHLVSELAEKAHLALAKRGWVSDHDFHRGLRTVFWVVFGVLAWVSGYTVFETLSPTGILSRALIYGPGLALAWVLALVVFEVAYSRRAWCRYVCPIGLTYGAVGVVSPVRVVYRLDRCVHELDCKKVCLVPHVLDPVVRGRAVAATMPIGPDCTRCGLCVDACPSGALAFEVKGLSKLL